MINHICVTCATQFGASGEPPVSCPICEDDRQYLGPDGQRWTTLDALQEDHKAEFREEEPHLLGIGMSPDFAIGQRALLLTTPNGNVLWDCMPLLDDEIARRIEALGGIDAIAISHPHYYSTMVEWAHAFGAPIHLHRADSEWVMRSDPSIKFWGAETLELKPGVTLIRAGGHFEGGTVLHWAAGAESKGSLLTGDIIQVIPDRSWVSFMYSYPNLIPLNVAAINRILGSVERFDFDCIHGAWFGRTIPKQAKEIVKRSAERYARAIQGP